jgi:hypothetical protein
LGVPGPACSASSASFTHSSANTRHVILLTSSTAASARRRHCSAERRQHSGKFSLSWTALTGPPRRRCPASRRVLWPSRASQPAHVLKMSLPVFTAHLAGLVTICNSPLLTGLSGLLPISGAPLAHGLSAFLGVFEGHQSSRLASIADAGESMRPPTLRPRPVALIHIDPRDPD